MNIINGEHIAQQIKQKLKTQIEQANLKPKLAILYIGDNAASEVYIEKKVAWGKEIGITTEVIRYVNASTAEIIGKLKELNGTKSISGYIIQLPIPRHLNRNEILQHIKPEKDVDGLSPVSLGLLWQGNNPGFIPATVLAILECIKFVARYEDNKYTVDELDTNESTLLERYLTGKKVLIINHSIIVGKPLAAKLLDYKSTVTIAHKDTTSAVLDKSVHDTDIIVSATGIKDLIKPELIHDGQVIIDAGINKTAQGIGGDVDHQELQGKKIWISPVPGGVGPITVAMLLQNTVIASKGH